ncbi:MAG: hypothetical protein QG662_2173 [Pseudomonadota bacterium]|nr:hypothetical protein [Pseudomonadota bacterium]
MIGALRELLNKIDSISERTLLWINVGISCFVALAHGGALVITYTKPTPDAEGIRQMAMFSLPVAAVIIITAAAAMIRPELRRKVLGVHGFFLACSAAALLLWASSLLVNEMPEGNFRWSIGMLSVWVAYSVFVLCRFSLPPRLRTHPAAFYAPVIALSIAATVDVGVFLRVAGEVGARLGG